MKLKIFNRWVLVKKAKFYIIIGLKVHFLFKKEIKLFKRIFKLSENTTYTFIWID